MSPARSALARRLVVACLVAAGALAARPVSAAPADAAQAARELRADPKYAFCTDPERPLGPRQRALCPMAAELEACEGFRAACDGPITPPSARSAWLDELLGSLGGVAQGLVWVLVALVALAILVPIARYLLRARRERGREGGAAPAPRVEVTTPVAEEDAALPPNALLARADARRAEGDHPRALALYLSASLAALAERGAVRLGRDRTNGEYVRACREEAARLPLREIVREVDGVEYGGRAATAEASERARARALAIVRAGIVAGAALLAGCGGLGGDRKVRDPAGKELATEILRRQGFEVGPLERSLATLPLPAAGDMAPVVIVDVEDTVLEDDAREHLTRWVEAGGVLVLMGLPEEWPKSLAATHATPASRDVAWLVPTADEDDDGAPVYAPGPRARLARPAALAWPAAVPLAVAGEATYAATRLSGRGRVIGVASSELLTNASLARPENAVVLEEMMNDATAPYAPALGDEPVLSRRAVRIARREDGVPPPANPFAALSRAGLGLGLWHAIAAALVLFAAYGVRQARPRPEPPAARRAFLEHVRAVGAFYGRARADRVALAAYARLVEERLRAAGTRGGLAPEELLAERAGVSTQEAREVLAHAAEAMSDPSASRPRDRATLHALVRLATRGLGPHARESRGRSGLVAPPRSG